MNEDTPLKTVKIRGKEFDIYVDSNGMFFSFVGGKRPENWRDKETDQIEARSMLELTKKLEASTKQVFNIPFCRWDDGDYHWRYKSGDRKAGIRHGKITGLHLANNNVLVEWSDGEKEQSRGYGDAEYLRLTPAEEKEYTRLQKLLDQTKKDIEKFEKQHAIDVRNEIEGGKPTRK